MQGWNQNLKRRDLNADDHSGTREQKTQTQAIWSNFLA